MDKKQFNSIFAESTLEVNSELNTLKSMSDRRQAFFEVLSSSGFDEEKAFEKTENNLYTEKLLYSVLSKIFVTEKDN